MTNLSAFDLYLKDVVAFKLLTRKEEIALSKIVLKNKNPEEVEKAKHKLVEANLRLVVKIATKYYSDFGSIRKIVSPLDLIAEGNICLMKSAESFNYKKGGFANYATFLIEKKMRKTIEKYRMVHIPYPHAGYWKRIERVMEKYGDQITDDIIASELHISCKYAARIRQGLLNASIIMLDELENWQEYIKNNENIEEGIHNKSLKEYICLKIDHVLTPREGEVCKILIEHPATAYGRIAKRLNLTGERIRQIYFSSLQKLRNGMIKEWEREHNIPDNQKYWSPYSKAQPSRYDPRDKPDFHTEEGRKQKIRKRIMKELLGEK